MESRLVILREDNGAGDTFVRVAGGPTLLADRGEPGGLNATIRETDGLRHPAGQCGDRLADDTTLLPGLVGDAE